MADDGFIHRSSDEQAEVNDKVARDPQGSNEGSPAQALTGHTTEPDQVVDEDTGKVVASHQTKVITDPQSPDAVQVPDPDVYPAANATKANPLGAQSEPSPNEVADGGSEADVTVSEKSDEDVQAGQVAEPRDDSSNDDND